VFYDWHHKQNVLSPIVMGLCRMLVYVTAAYAFAVVPPDGVFLMGLLLLCYLIGLTYAAKQEHLNHVVNLWPLAFVAVPMFWGLKAALNDAFTASIGLVFLVWVLYSLSFLRRRRAGDVPRAIGGLLAGICLWDALVVAAAGQPSVAVFALALFGLTLLLQRYVSPT
jgi:4-hydroxybenzoate polyprenyltransferase